MLSGINKAEVSVIVIIKCWQKPKAEDGNNETVIFPAITKTESLMYCFELTVAQNTV